MTGLILSTHKRNTTSRPWYPWPRRSSYFGGFHPLASTSRTRAHSDQPQYNGKAAGIKSALTFKNGGPPVGNCAYNPGWEWAVTDPPKKDQKFSG